NDEGRHIGVSSALQAYAPIQSGGATARRSTIPERPNCPKPQSNKRLRAPSARRQSCKLQYSRPSQIARLRTLLPQIVRSGPEILTPEIPGRANAQVSANWRFLRILAQSSK